MGKSDPALARKTVRYSNVCTCMYTCIHVYTCTCTLYTVHVHVYNMLYAIVMSTLDRRCTESSTHMAGQFVTCTCTCTCTVHHTNNLRSTFPECHVTITVLLHTVT